MQKIPRWSGGQGIASYWFKERVQVNGLPLQHIEEFDEPSLRFVHSSLMQRTATRMLIGA